MATSSDFLSRVLEPPTYGFGSPDNPVLPSRAELLREFASRLNVLRDRRNWLALLSVLTVVVPLSLLPIFLYGVASGKFQLWHLLPGFLYAVTLGISGTCYLHRFGSHRAFRFRNRAVLQVFRNLWLKTVPEEIYIVSHQVHHRYPDRPGDPYFAKAGRLYCFLAEVNHQPISRSLERDDYRRVQSLLSPMLSNTNSFEQYQRWGSVSNPWATLTHYLLNWAFWFAVFYAVGGLSLALATFSMMGVWALSLRDFNFKSHGSGRESKIAGVDFNHDDLAINRSLPGLVAGEWHGNHHLFPRSARCGFLPGQWDLSWQFISALERLGLVIDCIDDTQHFFERFPEAAGVRQKARA